MSARPLFSARASLVSRPQSYTLPEGVHRWIAFALFVPLLLVLGACAGGGGDDDIEVAGGEFKAIEISPPAGVAAAGTTMQFVATGIRHDGSTQDVTQRVSWSASDGSTALVDAGGLASAMRAGETTIDATLADGGTTLRRSAGFTVTNAQLVSISIAVSDSIIAPGTASSLVATGNFDDGTGQDISGSVSWQSSDPGIVSIDAGNARAIQANGISAGTADISATSGGISDTVEITVTDASLVSIAVTPLDVTVPVGSEQQFFATGSFSDGSTQALNDKVQWTSLDTAIATVSNGAIDGGRARALATGLTTITASLGGISGSSRLTVAAVKLATIAVTPSAPSIAAGTQQQFDAVGTYTDGSTRDLTRSVIWSSSDEDIATVANADGSQGLASSSRMGAATISATQEGIRGSTRLTVTRQVLVSIGITPTNPSIAAGTTRRFKATGTYTDNSTQDLTDEVSWRSGDTAVARIDSSGSNKGLAIGVAAGNTEISASLDAFTDATRLTVTPSVLVSLAIKPDAPSVPLGNKLQLTATGTYSDGRKQDLTDKVTWGPTNSPIASVSNAGNSKGLATTRSLGTVKVTASRGEISDDTELTVADAALLGLAISPRDYSLPAGSKQQYAAEGNYTDGSVKTVTGAVSWSSTDTGVATIDNAAGRKGLASALGVGNTRIEARLEGVVAGTGLRVTAPRLESLVVKPAAATIASGETWQFRATGNYSDGSSRDISEEVSWASADNSVASVSQAGGSKGLATGKSPGNTRITAISGLISGSAALQVNPPRLIGIEITPKTASITVWSAQQYQATASYSDGRRQDVTRSVFWSSSSSAIATIGNGRTLPAGLAVGIGPGRVTISATREGVEGRVALKVRK